MGEFVLFNGVNFSYFPVMILWVVWVVLCWVML